MANIKQQVQKMLEAKVKASKEAAKAKEAEAAALKNPPPAAKATEPPATVKPAAKATEPPAKAKEAAKPKPAADTFKLHLNKTGRLCIGSEAAARLGDAPFCKLSIEGKLVKLEPTKKEGEGAIEVKYADPEYAVRPYISASKAWKQLGWDGREGIDIEAKPLGSSGFQFRL